MKDACERHKQASSACIIPEILQRLKIPVNIGAKITHCEQTHELQRTGHSVNKPEDFIIRVLCWLLSAVNSCHTNHDEGNSIKQKCSKDTCETGREIFPYIPAMKTKKMFLCRTSEGWSDKALCQKPFWKDKPICSSNNTQGKTSANPKQTNRSQCMSEELNRLWIYLVWLPELFPPYIYIHTHIHACNSFQMVSAGKVLDTKLNWFFWCS